jgi:hypothetical protein
MRLAAIAEDTAMCEEWYEDILTTTTRNTKANDAQKRRESFAFRNGDARRIELYYRERRENEHESFELK